MKKLILSLILGTTLSTLTAQNVGIGSDNPQEKLHIYNGDVYIESAMPLLINPFYDLVIRGISLAHRVLILL